MTRLRQKYKKLKQMYERRPVKVIRQMQSHPVRVAYRKAVSDEEMANLKGFDFENRIREMAASAIAERLLNDGLVVAQKDVFYGGTEYYYEVMIIPPFKPIKCEPMEEMPK